MGQAKKNLEELRAEFEANPYDFINKNECLLVVQKVEDNQYRVLNNCKNIQEVFMVAGFAEEACQNRRDQIRVAQYQQKQTSGIIVPGMVGPNGQTRP